MSIVNVKKWCTMTTKNDKITEYTIDYYYFQIFRLEFVHTLHSPPPPPGPPAPNELLVIMGVT